MNPKLSIRIQVALDDEIIAQREALTFESAGEDLGKLERYYLSEQAKAEDRAEAEAEEIIEETTSLEEKAVKLENAYDATKEKEV